MRRTQLVFIFVLLAAATAHADTLDAAKLQDAKHHFQLGVASIEKHEFQLALNEFESSYRINPLPDLLVNIALSQKALGRHVEALGNLQRYLTAMDARGKGLSPARKTEVLHIIDEINTKVAKLTLSEPAGAVLRVDGRPAGKLPIVSMKVDPGAHDLELSADGMEPLARKVSVGAGETVLLKLEMHPLAPAKPVVVEAAPPAIAAPVAPPPAVLTLPPPMAPVATPLRFVRTPRGHAAIGLGVVALSAAAAAVVTGSISLTERSSYHNSCNTTCDNATYTSARQLAIATDTMLSVAGVAAVTSLALILTRPKHLNYAAAPILDGRQAGFVFQGRF